MPLLLAPPPKSQAKIEMAKISKSDRDFSVIELLNNWPLPYVCVQDVLEILNNPLIAARINFDLYEHKKWVSRAVGVLTTGYSQDITFRYKGKVSRPKVLVSALQDVNSKAAEPPEKDAPQGLVSEVKERVRNALNSNPIDCERMAEFLSDRLDEEGR